VSLTNWALRNVRPILFVTIALSIAGVIVYSTFPVSILPEVTFPRIVAVAEAGDMPQRLVEATITRPIEEAVATIPNVKRIRSRTKRGDTEISIDFTPEADIIVAEQLVNAKINAIRSELPPETVTEVERMNATVFPVLGLILNSKSLSPTELWNLATYSVKPRLSRVEGVARVIVQGGRVPEIEVAVRPNALSTFGLTMSQVVDAIGAHNQIRSAGRVDHEFQQYQVLVSGELKSLDDVANVVVAEREGLPIHVRQIADVHPAMEDKTTVVSANGGEAVLLNIVRQPSANSVAMVEAVNRELSAMKHDLPSDVTLTSFYDQSLLVKEATASVRDALLIGAALSAIVLMLFLRDLRATLVTASIIPTTLLLTFLLMRLTGLTLNIMTLGALAVGNGLVIDTAIVAVEAVYRHLEHSADVGEAVRLAFQQISAPLISSTLTTVVVFVPLAFLSGVAGAFFSALALTLTFALLVSLALALFVAPAICARFLRSQSREHSKEGGSRIELGYESLMRKLLRKSRWVAPIMGLAVLGTFFFASRLETGFMPAMDEGAFVLDYWSPPGTSLPESDRLLRKVDAILLATPEVESFSRRTGTELGFAITEPNRGDFAVMLRSNRHRDIETIMSEVRAKVVAQVPGLDVEFIQVLQDLVGDLAGNPNPIEVKLFGENKAEVEAVADKLSEDLGKVPGIVDVSTSAIEAGPELVYDVDAGKAGRLGMNSETLSAQANAAIAGTVATRVLQGDRTIAVRVREPFASRSDPESIGRIGVETPTGRVQLRDLAAVRIETGGKQTAREDQRRLVSVKAQLDGIGLGTAVGRVRDVLAKTHLPPGVTASIGGQFQSQQESFYNLTIVLGAAIVLVFSVMLFQFRAFGAPLVILALMPLSLFGAAAGLLAARTALNVASFMGVIMLVGIVVKNGILLLDRAQQEMDAGNSPEEAVIAGGRVRLRPILMTTLTAILGLVPLALGIGAGAEMQKPLAIAVIGGLVFSTILTLFLGPAMYCALRVKSRFGSEL
jgi:CzcA family heavy metal efflux pump